jgi:hypothetical protein
MTAPRVPTRRVLKRAGEVAHAKGYRFFQVSVPDGAVQLVTPEGVVLDQPQINAIARELEVEQEQKDMAALTTGAL